MRSEWYASRFRRRVVDVGPDPTHAEAQEAVDLAHPLRVAGGQVVVDGDHMDALARQRVEVHRQGGYQGLPFTRLHLGDPAEMEGHPSHQLDVEVALTDHPPGHLSDQGERFDQQVLEALPVVEALPEDAGHRLKLVVGARLHLRLEGVDQRHQFGQPTDFLSFSGAEDLGEHAHGPLTLLSELFEESRTRPVLVPAVGAGATVQAVRTFSRSTETELAGRRRGWVRPTIRPLVFSSWCSSFSTTRSTATSGSGAAARARTELP